MFARELDRNGPRQARVATPVVVLGAILLLFSAVPAGALDCQIPLFVKQGLAGANVMILADNSGSMNEAMFHPDYDPLAVYDGRFTSDATYFVAKDRSYTPSSFNRRWESSPAADLIDGENGQDGRYPGNYLNWIYYHATDAQRAVLPQQSRLTVLKEVLTDLVDRSQQLRFGLTKFQYDHGGSVIANCGSNTTSVKAQIAGLTGTAWTPLGESMETIVDYFSNDRPNAPIQESCQYNFVIVVTDGLPTMDLDVSGYLFDADRDGNEPGNCASIGAPYGNQYDCSDHFDDVAYYMAHEDLRSDLEGEQNVFTYVVGFNAHAPILVDAATNGNGLYFHAKNAGQLAASLEWAVQDVLRRISAGSAVAVVSTERGTDDRLYRGKFMPLDWHGFLESYALPYKEGDAPVWEAGDILASRKPATREIFTALGKQAYKFDTSAAADLKSAMMVFTDEEAANLIEWGRGEDVPGYRDRQGWVLGDIVHSTPTIVGAPADYRPTHDYDEFRAAYEFRRKLVYVGANDGMLHAFDAETGNESWAFVPEFALPRFEVMADSGYCHAYSCDQSVSVRDMKIGSSWRTILASGGGEGSAAVYAMDVTDPDAPRVMWQAALPDGNAGHSEIEMVSIGGTPVALVGSGLDVSSGEAWLHAYELAGGTHLGSLRLSRDASAPRNRCGRPAGVDLNLDGETDVLYVADMLGSVYRLDTRGYPHPSDWSVSELYEGDQEISADVTVAFGPDMAVYVYFGTGAYLDDADVTSVDPQSFICVFDRHTGGRVRKSDLADQTRSIGDVTADSGWYVDLWNHPGERVTETAAVVAETVIFTSFSPSGEACTAGGESWLYQMRYDTGGVPENEDMQDPVDRSESVGEGIASYPVVDITTGEVVVQSSDASIEVRPIASQFLRMAVRSWQESFDVAAPPQAP